jgi:hypothetical protein
MTVPSDPIQPATAFPDPARPQRPGTVTISGYLLIGIALVSLLGVVTALASYPTVRDVFTEAYKGTAMENSAGAVAIATLIIGILSVLLFGVGAAVLAPLVLKGKQPARIITWVLCGLLICCQGGGLASSGFSGASFGQSGSANGVDMEQVQKQLNDGLADWIRPVELVSGGLLLVLAVAVIVLLTLPASHPFFRKQQEQQWAPPAYPTV